MKKKTSTSKGARERVKRAINQLHNVRALLSGMPKKIWVVKHDELTNLIEELDEITEKTRSELANGSKKD